MLLCWSVYYNSDLKLILHANFCMCERCRFAKMENTSPKWTTRNIQSSRSFGIRSGVSGQRDVTSCLLIEKILHKSVGRGSTRISNVFYIFNWFKPKKGKKLHRNGSTSLSLSEGINLWLVCSPLACSIWTPLLLLCQAHVTCYLYFPSHTLTHTPSLWHLVSCPSVAHPFINILGMLYLTRNTSGTYRLMYSRHYDAYY